MASRKQFVVGIDPGASGAVALVGRDHKLLGADLMPVEKGHAAGTLEIDVRALRDLFDSRGTPAKVYVELVGPLHLASKKSTWTFARYFEALVSLCKLAGYPYELAAPKVWQKAVLAGTDHSKQAVIAWVNHSYPGLNVTHDGIADSVAIAEYGWQRTFGRFAD